MRQQTTSEKIVQLNEEAIKGQIKELVRDRVEETLNKLLEVEVQKLARAVWYECSEHHSGVIIFDEPAQQSIGSEDLNSFIQSVSEVSPQSQIIMVITLNSHELIHIIDELDTGMYHKLEISDKAFKRFEKWDQRKCQIK